MKLFTNKCAGFGLVFILMIAAALTACGGNNGGAATCIVIYDGNGEDGGSVPVDDNDYEEGQFVTVLGNTGDLVKAGYTFAGWNTRADGSGTTYAQDQTFTMEAADVILYAKWTDSGAGAGDLDTSFGGTGVVTTDIDGMGFAMAIQGDGKILVAGSGDQATVVRYNADGTLDPTFGINGIVTLPAGGNSLMVATALAIERGDSDDFRIVVAGIGTSSGFFRMAAARLNANGSLDTSFAATSVTPGIFYSPFTSNGSYGAQDVAIQDDGKIVLVGETADRFAVVRLTDGGGLDSGFGGGAGYVTTVIQDHSHANAVAIQDDGKIVAAGQSYADDGSGGWWNWAASIARYNTDGSLDSGNWGGPGYIYNTYIPDATAMAIQNGRIVIAGGHLVNSYDVFAMIGFDTIGWLDGTFGDGGFVTTSLGDSATAYAIALSDEGILLAGRASVGLDAMLAVARYSANGSLDATFGSPDGYVFTVVGASPCANGVAIDSSDRIVVAGGQGQSPSAYFVACYLP